MPPPEEIDGRLAAVCHVLYLIFNEGYTPPRGARVNRTELTTEASAYPRSCTGFALVTARTRGFSR